MRLSYDRVDENGDKIRIEKTGAGGEKKINMSVMFERPGKRIIGMDHVDILVFEALEDFDGRPVNVGRPASVEVAREARRRIERARARGLSPAEAIGVNEDEDRDRQTFSERLDERAEDGRGGDVDRTVEPPESDAEDGSADQSGEVDAAAAMGTDLPPPDREDSDE